ncbi:MICAL-like protein 1 [Centroberyx affinis]|uniref:MICAL-like protein 1 n=1 Tax=Centroberyx affinis TaxID=166261 RepID=UPI003A5BF7CC
MGSPKALLEWCRVKCANYPNVDIKNMSTSFRDGLAFCAIIHKHRPDLIDFSSLSKDNVYQNNRLAFEVAETKLGIPALLDPKDMVSTEVPDRLSVITYLSQYYYFFNKKFHASPASLRSSHVTSLANPTKSRTPDVLKPPKSLPDRRSSREDHLSSSRTHSVCSLCRKPVHLVQRHLIDGEIYHRSCFRCKVCCSTLLPGSYKQGSDAGSLICTHHITDSRNTRVDFSRQQIGSTENLPKLNCQERTLFLGGFTDNINHLPHYAEKTESQDRLVCVRVETEGRGRNTRQERSREVKERESTDSARGSEGEVKRPAPPPPHRFKDRAPEGAGEAGPSLILADSKLQVEAVKSQGSSGRTPTSLCAAVSGGCSRPVPAPRRTFNSSAPPVPAPRTKTFQRMDSSSATGNSPSQSKSSSNSSRNTSPASGSHKVRSNHPWMTIVHPGPWTQLPPAPAPITPPRSSSVPGGSWFRPRVTPPNPFGEVADEDTQDNAREEGTKTGAANQTKLSEASSQSENGRNLPKNSGDTHAPVRSSDTANAAAKSKPDDKAKPPDKPIPPKKPAFKGTAPTTMDSAQKEQPAASSGPSGRRGDSGASANKPKAPDASGSPSMKTSHLAAAESALGVPDVASGLGVPKLEEAPSGLGVPDPAEATSALGVPDLAGPASGPGIPDVAEAANGLGVPDPAEAASGLGVPELEEAPSGLGVPDPAEATSALGVPELAGPASGPGTPDVAEAASGLGVPDPAEAASGLGVPELAEAASGLGVPDPAEAASGLGVSELAGAAGELAGGASELDVPDLVETGGIGGLADTDGGLGVLNLADADSGLGVAGLTGVASGLEAPDFDGAVSGHGVPGLAGAKSRGGLVDAASDLGLPDLAAEVPDLAGASAGLCLPDVTEADAIGGAAGAAGGLATSDVAQSRPFPKSVSVPAVSSALLQSPSVSADLMEAIECEQAAPSQSKACKENPFDRKAAIPKSKTFQAPASRRSPAPGYGFPLVKRKVQSDRCVPIEDLQVEMGELDKRLETLELRGVELERNLRDCKNDKVEEEMLMDWFSLIHEKHVLVRRDAELVYLTKQQTLEERQADVEYELRCLLNKPESEWSLEDRGREQQLMDELVTVIEQRNQIISSLDQDRQREKEEDVLFEAMMTQKEFQKEGLKELKKSKGKFKPMKVLKMLSLKAESAKDCKDKTS